MVAFIATAADTWTATNTATPSSARTLPAADAILLVSSMNNGNGDTIAATIDGGAPTESFQNLSATSTKLYLAVFVGAPSGSQTVALSGGDSTDDWGIAHRGIDTIDEADPFDNEVNDVATDEIVEVTTTADGLGFGVANFTDDPATSDTEVFENSYLVAGSVTVWVNGASTPGTGGAVELNWTGTGSTTGIGINLRNGVAAGPTIPILYPHYQKLFANN